MKMPLLIALISLCFAGSALAHPKMTGAVPAADGKVAVAPKTLRLTFNEEVMPNFSGVTVKTAAGKTAKTGRPSVDPTNHKVLIVPLIGLLAPGAYQVEWHAVSADTHRVTGHYGFSIG